MLLHLWIPVATLQKVATI